jgi:hypothetical protein
VSVLFGLLLFGCGDHVVVAEQLDAGAPKKKTESDANAHVSGVDADAYEEGVLMCGHSRCTNHPLMSGGVQLLNGYACCADAAHSTCGVVIPIPILGLTPSVQLDNCIPLNQPGHPEDSCAPVTIQGLGTLRGCCRPGGSCGSYESTIGIGCIFIPINGPAASCTY